MFSIIVVSPQGDLPHSYSPHVIHFIPVKRLLLECTKQQVHYAPLYPRLIKLLVTHLPHLCLVTDWMEQEEKENSSKSTFPCCYLLSLSSSYLYRFSVAPSSAEDLKK